MTQYNISDHKISISSNIKWFGMVRPGTIPQTKVLNQILQDMKALQNMEESIASGEAEIFKNSDLSDQGRRRQLRTLAEQQIKPKVELLESRIESMTRGMNEIMRDITAEDIPEPDMNDARAAIREQEIRQHFKGKKAGEILEAIREAEKNEDHELIRALELAPASIAVGPQDAIQQNRMERLRRKFPEQMERYDSWADAIEIYNTALDDLQRRLSEIQQAAPAEGDKSNYDRIADYNNARLGIQSA